MGNRAVIAYSLNPSSKCCYLHWNGGRASIIGFLGAMRHKFGGFTNGTQFIEEFHKMTSEWFTRSTGHSSAYIQTLEEADVDNYDNGLYLIDPERLEITHRMYNRHNEEVDDEKSVAIALDCLEILSR